MNKMKKFFTLDRHHAEGFTLVELIVVIAILAILGGVAVPAYSGYIEKTNKTADQTLVAEIERALTLAYYNGDLSEGSTGFLMLSPNEGESFDSQLNTPADYSQGGPVAEAMEKYFGSNWMNFMQLKYGSWDVKNMMLSYEDAQAVVNSDFMNYSSNELMDQVQALTSAVRKIDGALDDSENLYYMYNYGTDDNVLDDLAKEYYGEDASWATITDETTKSNLLVLATASSINGNPTDASGAISQYANYAAYAAVDPTFGAAYDTFVADVSKATDMDSAKQAYTNLVNASKTTDYDNWVKTAGNNTTAFNAIMAGVGNAMKDNGDAIIADLSNPDMFSSGIGSEMFNDYLASAYAMAANPAMLDMEMSMYPGCVLVQYAVVDGVFYFANSMPIF